MYRTIVLGLFIIAILFFLLPWVNLSCLGQTVTTVSGFDMITGTKYTVPSGITQTIDTEPLVVYALITAVIGIIVSLFKWKGSFLLRIILGITGVAILIALKIKFDKRVNEEGEGIVNLNYLVGYWLTMIIFAISAIMGFFKENFAFRFNSDKDTHDQANKSISENPLDNNTS